jgi:hypothetical protein
MFKKIEIWILYLTLILVVISYIFYGAVVRRYSIYGEHLPVFKPISIISVFLAEIPSNFKKILNYRKPTRIKMAEVNPEKFGFNGEALNFDSYLLMPRYNSNVNQSTVELIDLKTFEVLHEWKPEINEIWSKIRNEKIKKHYLKKISIRNFRAKHALMTKDGGLIVKNNSPLLKLDSNSNVIWMLEDAKYHHGMELDHEGNIWVCVEYKPYKTKEIYSGKWNDKYYSQNPFKDDGIRKISNDGDILFDKPLTEIFLENDLEHLLVNPNNNHRDLFHLNDIQPVYENSTFWEVGDVFLSLRHQNFIIHYRPNTNEIIHLIDVNKICFGQHDIDIISNSKISIFNNNTKFYSKHKKVFKNNEIIIYDFKNNTFTNDYKDLLSNHNIKTIGEGLCEIMPNNDLFIEETGRGRLLYFNSDGELKWSFYNRPYAGANSHIISWSRILYQKEDLAIVNNFLKSIAK